MLVVGNTISDVRQGVYFTPTQRNVPSGAGADPRPQFDTDYFNYIARNTITRSTKGVAIETYRNGAGVAPVGYGSAALATVVRENDFSLFEIATTFNSTYRNYVIGVDADWQYRAADLTIFEDNTYFTGGDPDAELTGVRTFSGFSGTTFDTIIRNNHFEGLPDAATSVNSRRRVRRDCSTTSGTASPRSTPGRCRAWCWNSRRAWCGWPGTATTRPRPTRTT